MRWRTPHASLDGATCSHLCGNFQLWITCLLQLPRYLFRLRKVSSGWDGKLQGYYSTQIPWSTLRHVNICKRKYSQSEYSKAGVYWIVLYPTFPSCAARMSQLILLATGIVFANSIKSYLVWQNVSQQVFHYQRQIQILHTKKERKKNKKTKPNQIPLYFYQCSNDIFGYFGDQCVLMRRA